MSSDSTKRFSTRVPYYVRSRPGYPAAIVEFLKNELSLNPNHVIADIGSGTGILSELFLRNGNTVYGVEPNPEMRAAGVHQLAAFPQHHSIDATAEATTLPDASIDFITAGQAFHWFDPEKSAKEFRRILRPSGWVVLVWNERRSIQSGFNAAYDLFIERYSGDKKVAAIRGGSLGAESRIQTLLGERSFQLHTFENHQDLNLSGLLDRVYSSSYMPLPDDPLNAQMTEDLRQLFNAFAQGGFIRIEYQTRLYYGRLH